MTLQIGETVGPYEVISLLGQGGMATVYKAYHKRLDRYVAIKVMHQAFLQDDSFLARFEREARIVARLEHSNIVPVYDYSDHETQPYLVMKFIEGPTLKRRALKQGLSLEETAGLMTPLAEALDYAHARDVLHRDMKPSNILLDLEDRPYITDFGLARIAQTGASTMSADMMLGTPFYISPEQAQGSKDLDARTDIYAFGVILYELVTGTVPFNADAAYAIVYSHIHQKPDLPSTRNTQIPKELDPIILKALAKNPQERYPTTRALMHDFNAVLASNGRNVPYTPKPIERDTSSPTMSLPIPNTGAEKPKGPTQTLVENTPTAEKPLSSTPSTEPKQRRVEVEGSLNLGDLAEQFRNVRWDQVGEQMKSRVQNFATMIEESIDSEMKARGVTLEEEQEASEAAVRKRVAKRMKARREVASNVASYLFVNAGLIALWAFIMPGGFFWPFFPIFFWGMGVVGHIWSYYSEYGPGQEQQREWMEREVERELRRSQMRKRQRDTAESTARSKIKNEMPLDEAVDMSALQDRLGDAPRPRVNDEGELTDSFVEEAQRGRFGRRGRR